MNLASRVYQRNDAVAPRGRDPFDDAMGSRE
jgi:hypothetical protein